MGLSINFTYIIVILALLVIILSNLEMYKSKQSSLLALNLPKISTTIPENKFGTKYPIYIYNAAKLKRNQLTLLPTKSDIVYIKHEIPVHVAAKIMQPLKDMWGVVCKLPFTKLPINTLYTGLNKSDTLLTNINPLINPDKGKYRMLIAKEDVGKVETFIDDKLYFVA